MRHFLVILGLCGIVAAPLHAMKVSELRCEQLENPLGIDTIKPRLSWKLSSDKRGQIQTAYEVLVASSEGVLKKGIGDVWDSAKVPSDQTIEIRYAGSPLQSRQQCFWKVRVWDHDGKVSESKMARWEMGLLKPSDWTAKWIARTTDNTVPAAPLFRTPIPLGHGKIKKARAYICGLGYFELYVNGKRVGDHILDPGFTRYDKRDLYVTLDILPYLDRKHPADNAAGVILGNGWFNVINQTAWDWNKAPWRAAPKLLCQIEFEYVDGHRAVIGTDDRWMTSDSSITYNTIYSGEVYDARLEQPGWATSRFNNLRWSPALPVDAPLGVLSAQMMPPIRVDQTFPPQSITEPAPGVYLFDFGQSVSGNARLSVAGPAGTKVSMRYGERLTTNGQLDQAGIAQHLKRFDKNQRFQNDIYILRGEGKETWGSRFNYNGFRYVEVRGFPGKPDTDSLTAVFFHSDVPPVGEFECSNPLLNKIAAAARRSYLGNLEGIPTDCPHREKNGWMGDAHLAAELGMFNFDPSAVYTKWIQDIADEQHADGKLPGIVPSSGWGYAWGNGPAWDSALVLIPYYQYLYFGHDETLRHQYEHMKRYVDYLTSRAKDDIVSIGLNDWAPYKTKTDAAITDTAYYYIDTKIVALAAELLGRKEDAQQYKVQAKRIAEAFQNRFFHPDNGSYDNGGQTALSCALYQGLVPAEDKSIAVSNLVDAVQKANWHIDTGILGAKYLLNALTENGRTDVAYRIATQTDQPSWGWWIGQGATTLWEEWDGSDSRFHVMFGDIDAWFFKALAGINPDPAAPGFKHFFITPNPVGDLTWARASYDSVRGKIISDWKLKDGRFTLNLKVPPGTSATVTLPIADPHDVKEGHHSALGEDGITFEIKQERRTVWRVPAGSFIFSGPMN